MGVDSADYDRSGRAHLLVGNFSTRCSASITTRATASSWMKRPLDLGRASLLNLTFGVFFFDYDLDGRPDIFAANGHIEEEIGSVQPKIQYRQPPLLFHNDGKASSRTSARCGSDFSRPIVARGAAYGDFDGDGDLDVLITNNNGPACLFRNDGGNKNHWITIRPWARNPIATAGSRCDGRIRVRQARAEVRSGSSYCSQSQLALTFGLGKDARVDAIEIRWPRGISQKLGPQSIDRVLTITEK